MSNDFFKIAIVSDPHHYSRTLGDSGKAYEGRSGTDQKCLAETGAIIDAAFDILKDSDVDAVLIAGDLSNDGERVSHEEVLPKLYDLQKYKPVYVVYATHDWCCDGNARRYSGQETFHDVPTVTPGELRELYRPFGAEGALSEFIHPNGSSSYCAVIKEGCRLLGLNDDRNGKGKAGYTEEHLEWIIDRINEAKAAGDTIIAMQHHLIMPHLAPLINSSQCIGDRDEMAATLADAGLEFIFVGHSHMQRTAVFETENGGRLYQVNIGSLCGYPAPYTYFTIDKNKAVIDVKHLERFTFDGKELDSDYIKRHTAAVLTDIIDTAIESEDALCEKLGEHGIKADSIRGKYKLIKKAAGFIKNSSVGKAAGLINAFTFGKGINRRAVKEIKDESLYEYVLTLFLAVFDGSVKTFDPDSAVYRVVTDVASLPRRVTRFIPVKALRKPGIQGTFAQIESIAKKLAAPDIPNNYLEIERKTLVWNTTGTEKVNTATRRE